MDTVLKYINGEEKQNVYPMFTLIGFKTTKPLDNQEVLFCLSDPAGIRTQDPYIKSVLLYQLSYGILFFLNNSFVIASANLGVFFGLTSGFSNFFLFFLKLIVKILKTRCK